MKGFRWSSKLCVLVLGSKVASAWGGLDGLNMKTSLTRLHSEQPKEAWRFWKYFPYKYIFLKTFECEMLIKGQTTNLLQIFCELSLHSEVIFKSMKVADDISRGTLECEWVNLTCIGKTWDLMIMVVPARKVVSMILKRCGHEWWIRQDTNRIQYYHRAGRTGLGTHWAMTSIKPMLPTPLPDLPCIAVLQPTLI